MSAISINTKLDFWKKEFWLGEFLETFLEKIENIEDQRFWKLMKDAENDKNISTSDFKNFLKSWK